MLYMMDTRAVKFNRNLNFKKFKFIAKHWFTDFWYCWQCYENKTTGAEATMFWHEKNEQGKRLRNGSRILNASTNADAAASYSQTASIE